MSFEDSCAIRKVFEGIERKKDDSKSMRQTRDVSSIERAPYTGN